MTAADLLDSLETLADAPGGIDHLRELVLHLAVRGRLVPQDSAEEPAFALLEHITEERQRLVEAGSLRKQKPQVPVQSQETPFDIPESWAWARLGHYCALEMGQSPPSEFYNQDGEGLPFFQGKADFGDLNPTPRYWCTRPAKYADGGDVLLSVRAPVGPTNIATEECCIGRGIAGLRPLGGTPTMMLLWTMRAFEADLCALGTGTTFVAISKKNLEPFVLPVPPLAEQHRIVARVDELMDLLDRLEAAKEARDATRAQLRDAALAALQDAGDAEEVKTAWSRIADHMHDLFTDPADIPPLRRTILELAVHGRLVPQSTANDPANELLERIAAEKAQLVEDGMIKKSKPLPPLTSDETPFALPEGWAWCRLGHVLLGIEAGWSPSALKRPKEGEEWGVLKVSSCSWGNFRPEENKALPPGTDPRVHLEVQHGDFLISRANTLELVARSVVVAKPPRHLMLSDKTLRLTPSDHVCVGYLNLVNLSESSRQHYGRHATGTSASMRNVSQEAIRELPIPLPPAAEQRSILEAVDELTALLIRLETTLRSSQESQAAFCASAVRAMPDSAMEEERPATVGQGESDSSRFERTGLASPTSHQVRDR